MKPPRVHFTGGDQMGWALDDDLSLVRRATQGVVDASPLESCDIIHSVWWEPLLRIPRHHLDGKRIICHLSGEPRRYMTLPAFQRAVEVVGTWVAQSTQAEKQMRAMGFACHHIPYAFDPGTFHAVAPDDPDLQMLRTKWNLPTGKYILGNFHRDTEGSDLISPKLVKGPDSLAEIAAMLVERGLPVHILLAGPRRHWLIRELSQRGLPFTYVGVPQSADDIKTNTLARNTLNLLYNLMDLCLVSSRSEGAPRSILESAAAGRAVASTRVGLAEDVLEPCCLFNSITGGADLIAEDISSQTLQKCVEVHSRRVLEQHTPEILAPRFSKLLSMPDKLPVTRISHHSRQPLIPQRASLPQRVVRKLMRRFRKPRDITVGLWHGFHRPPWGGGNQFMMALRGALSRKGVRIVENRLTSDVDVHLFNSIHFDVERLKRFAQRHRLCAVHRIDGPIACHRANGVDLDNLCFELNAEFASLTVFQSHWTFKMMVEAGHRAVRPMIVHNAVDSSVFHRPSELPSDQRTKIRLISNSWSDNLRKGGEIYKWIEEHLDWGRFEYTFVGNSPITFKKIKHIPPVNSQQLANLLRQHHIYITASKNESCSNSLLEALACGLPALCLDSGSASELLGHGGLLFNEPEEIFGQLDLIAANLAHFQRTIAIPTIDQVADKYIEIFKMALEKT